MGCFGFKKLRKTCRGRKVKERAEAYGDDRSGYEDGRLMEREAVRLQHQKELTVVSHQTEQQTTTSESSVEAVITTAPDVTANVVLRRALPVGDHVDTVTTSNNNQVRLTKEYLTSEIDSLRTELEMRKEELQSLKQGYNELCDIADKLERTRSKVREQTARIEDLQAQLHISKEAERKLAQEKEDACAALTMETREKELLSQKLDEAEYKISLLAADSSRNLPSTASS